MTTHQTSDIRELSSNECDLIAGAGFWSELRKFLRQEPIVLVPTIDLSGSASPEVPR